ncbi:MAG: hypothetical protein ACYS9X_07500 [Planctomycetota bacterium]|jgi:hypothetical protein
MASVILIAVIVAAGVALHLARRGSSGALLAGRRPAKRRLVTRIVCGSLGGLILVAVAVGTFREVGRVYAGREAQDVLEVSLPTLQPPTPEGPPNRHRTDLQFRVLFHLLIGEVSGGNFVPVRVLEHDIRIPEDSGALLADEFEVDGFQVDCRPWIDRAHVVRDGRDLRIRPFGGVDFGWETSGSAASGGGHFHDAGVQGLGTLGWGRPQHAPLSVVPGAASRLHAVYIVTVVDLDDPLRRAPASDLVRLHAREIAREAGARVRVARRRDMDIPMPGIALAAHIGASALLLVAAAALLSQVFARRLLAFAGTLAGVVLFVAILDRAALGSHLSRVEDTEAPLGTRMTACARAAETFFFRKTAFGRIGAVLKDESTPPELEVRGREVRKAVSRLDYLREQLDAQDEGARLEAAELLLFSGDRNERAVARARGRASRREPKAMGAARGLLKSEDANTRVKAAMLLADAGDASGRDVLNRALAGNVLWVLGSLAKVADTSSVPFLVAELRKPENDEVVESGSSSNAFGTRTYRRTKKDKIATVLRRVTGADLGTDADEWEAWLATRAGE